MLNYLHDHQAITTLIFSLGLLMLLTFFVFRPFWYSEKIIGRACFMGWIALGSVSLALGGVVLSSPRFRPGDLVIWNGQDAVVVDGKTNGAFTIRIDRQKSPETVAVASTELTRVVKN